MPRLIYDPGSGETKVFDLQRGVNYVGRREDNNIILPCASVSGRHCSLTVQDGQIVLTDLDSTNGSFVGNQRVATANLQPGQQFRLGDAQLLVEGASESVADPPKKAPTARLRISTNADHASPPPAPPPPVAASPAVAAPPVAHAHAPAASHGPSPMCKYHPKSPARWHCGKCGKSFCDMCVSTRASAQGTMHTCRTCGVECSPVTFRPVSTKRRSFFAVMPGAFIYPFKQGMLALIVGSIIYALFSLAVSFVGLWGISMIIFFYGYFFSYMQNVIHATAMGESDVEWPTPTDFVSEILAPFFQLVVCVLFSFGPAIGLVLWGALSGNTALLIGAIAAFAYGCLYFPMSFLSVAMFDSVVGVNPIVVVPSIMKVFFQYILACIVLAIVFAVNKGLQVGLAILLPMPIVPAAITSFFTLYFLLVEARMLGLLYMTTKHKLGWFAR